MEKPIESSAASEASKPIPPEPDGSSSDTAANFDVDAFVHTSADGYGNSSALPADSSGPIDVAALGSMVGSPDGAGRKLTRKEKKAAKREMKARAREAKLAEREARKSFKSVKGQLKDRDKELTAKTEGFRRRRERAKSVVEYIGYNRMYQDGICEVEEGLFSASLAFDDTSYHSVRDEQQKAMFSALTRLYRYGRPMVITTNLDGEQMSQLQSGGPWSRIFDRILEVCYPVKVIGNRRKERELAMRKSMRERLGL